MLSRVFPKQFGNDYRGSPVAVWLFVPIVLVNLAKGLNTLLNTRDVLAGADGIPLDAYGADAAQAVASLFALGGVSRLALASLGVIALIRYRAMIPLLFLIYLAEHAGRRILLLMEPIARSDGTPVGFYINIGLLALLAIGFVLSLQEKDRRKDV